MEFDLNVSLHSKDFADASPDSDVGQSSEFRGEEIETVQTLIHELEAALEVGNTFTTTEEVYLLFCEYGRCHGFSVRKGNQLYFPNTKEVRMKEYICSCEGYYEEKKKLHRLMDYKKQIYRTGCKAKLRIVRENDCPWKVQRFVKDHNHELVPYNESYLLRSARNLTHAKKSLFEALNYAGVGVSQAHRFMAKEAGGPQNIGITKKDAYNHMHGLRHTTKVENSDANGLIQHLIQKSHSEPFFYWNVQLDDDGRLMNFFLRDSRCLMDYEIFVDVVSVGTTYRTNRYDLIVAPFVGINPHMSNVMFGLGFLSNETTESFEWLFAAFLDSMHGQEPQVIFSDQCQALMNGIDSTFRTSRHRLCQWHINRNAPSHFGSLNGDKAFKGKWHKCMNGVESEDEFEECWTNFIRTYSLEQNRWFAGMYKLRRRWAAVFTHDCFSAGLHATSRSEVTNKILKGLCSAKSSLCHFVECYEQIQTDWRIKESADDAHDIGIPGQYVKHNPLLIDAAKLFTRKVFKAFEEQLGNCVNVYILEPPSRLSDLEIQFKVTSQPSLTRIRLVQYNCESHIASCTCHMWETTRVLCKHVLKIYSVMNVLELPEWCIMPRWCKNAKLRHMDYINKCSKKGISDSIDGMSFVSYGMRMTYEVLNTSKHDKECRKVVLENLKSLQKQITTLLSASPSLERAGPRHQSDSPKPSEVRDPRRSKRTRTSNAPRRSHWSKGKNKNKKRKQVADEKLPDIEGSASVREPKHESAHIPSEGMMYDTGQSNWFSSEFFDNPFNVSQHSNHDNFSTPIYDNFRNSGMGPSTRI